MKELNKIGRLKKEKGIIKFKNSRNDKKRKNKN